MGNIDCQYKILAIERILQDNPDGVTVKEIIEKLDFEYGVSAERKAIYKNIDVLSYFLVIAKKKNKNHEYVYKVKELE